MKRVASLKIVRLGLLAFSFLPSPLDGRQAPSPDKFKRPVGNPNWDLIRSSAEAKIRKNEYAAMTHSQLAIVASSIAAMEFEKAKSEFDNMIVGGEIGFGPEHQIKPHISNLFFYLRAIIANQLGDSKKANSFLSRFDPPIRDIYEELVLSKNRVLTSSEIAQALKAIYSPNSAESFFAQKGVSEPECNIALIFSSDKVSATMRGELFIEVDTNFNCDPVNIEILAGPKGLIDFAIEKLSKCKFPLKYFFGIQQTRFHIKVPYTITPKTGA